MASRELLLSEEDLKKPDAELDQLIADQLGPGLAERNVDVRKAAKGALGTPPVGGGNAVRVFIPLHPTQGDITATRCSKTEV